MPTIIDYPAVLEGMQSIGLRSLYYNGGSFGFAPSAPTRSLGWIGPPDDTIRPEAKPMLRQFPEPFDLHLTNRLVQAWADFLPGPIWLMPGTSWAYELDFGSKQWLPGLLQQIGIDPNLLQPRTNASAIEFALSEQTTVGSVIQTVFQRLQGSDFHLAFPGKPVVAMVHHHQQVWWTGSEAKLIESLESLAPFVR